jgi:hypothetical protein
MLIWGHLHRQEKRFEASVPMISIPASTRPVGHKSEARARTEPSYELWTVLAALTLLYVVAMLEGNRRFVWFDELYTLDIAKARTIPANRQI